MAHKIDLLMSEIEHTLFNDFPELLNANLLPPPFKFDQADGQYLLEMHLLIRSDTIDPPFQLIRNAVDISDTSSGGFSPTIR
jgi:hypothetical protein